MSDSRETSGEFIPPDPAGDPAAQADELFIHGVLGSVHDQASGADARRMSRLEATIREAGRAPTPTPTPRRVAGRRLRRLVGVGCVALSVVVGSWLLIAPATSQARATLLASISAAKGAGERRYEIRTTHEKDAALPATPEGIFDGADGLCLLRLHAPDGHTVIAGRDATGEWAIRREGGIERSNPRAAWPKWATADGESIFADSVDQLMEALTSGFDLNSLENERSGDRTLHKIEGVRREGSSPRLADRVRLWIDADTMLLDRMEMEWDRPPRPPGPGVGAPNGGNPREGQPDRNGDHKGPPGMRPPPPDGMPPPPEGRPPFDPDRPPPPRPGGPEGREGPPPALGGPSAPGGPLPRGGPIRKLVVTRVEAPTLPADWFTPERHADGSWGEP